MVILHDQLFENVVNVQEHQFKACVIWKGRQHKLSLIINSKTLKFEACYIRDFMEVLGSL
jgi:hypothetical protein